MLTLRSRGPREVRGKYWSGTTASSVFSSGSRTRINEKFRNLSSLKYELTQVLSKSKSLLSLGNGRLSLSKDLLSLGKGRLSRKSWTAKTNMHTYIFVGSRRSRRNRAEERAKSGALRCLYYRYARLFGDWALSEFVRRSPLSRLRFRD